MAKKDYYEILGVPRNAGDGQIKSAFKKLALKYHPDRNRDDPKTAERRFKEAAEAYQVLSDQDKRRRYDRFGHEGLAGEQVGGFRGSGIEDIFQQVFGGDMGDLFGGLFGGGRRAVRRGADLEYDLQLDLEEAVFGTKKVIKIARHEMCPECRGTGCAAGTRPIRCPACDGQGMIQRSAGFFSMRSPCPSCHGQGEIIPHPCPHCNGAGRAAREIPVEVAVPQGVPSGATLRVAGQGELGDDGAPRGDLFCNIHVREHEFFERRDDHLLCRAPISYCQAALGAELDVPTLNGKRATIHVRPGTQSGDIFRLKSLGVPHLRSPGRGDQLVQVYIEVPKKLTPEHERLIRQLAELESRNVTPRRKSFLRKLKKYFSAPASHSGDNRSTQSQE